MPDAVGLELIAKEINAAHEGAVSETGHEYGSATLVIAAESNLEVLRWLEETPGQEYTFCSSVHGADYLPAEPRFAVHYELLNRDRVERIHVKALLGDPSAETDDRWGEGPLPTLRSSVGIFPTAEFQEREIYDFFGIVFDGHPDLRRITMPEDYVGWPQRRDFPIGGEPVIFTNTERERAGWYE